MKEPNVVVLAVGMYWTGALMAAGTPSDAIEPGLWGTGGILLAELLFLLVTRRSRRGVAQP